MQIKGKTLARVDNKDISTDGSFIVPIEVIHIGNEAFNGLYDLKKVIISKAVKSIGSNAFYNCTNLEEISIGDGLEVIKDYAFYNCRSLNSITLPYQLHTIERSVVDP